MLAVEQYGMHEQTRLSHPIIVDGQITRDTGLLVGMVIGIIPTTGLLLPEELVVQVYQMEQIYS